MATQSRAEAQQRVDDIRVFAQELERLERAGVVALTDAQRRAIGDYHQGLLAQYAQEHDVDHDTRSKQLSLGMRVVSFLGALALAASVFFLFRQFWDRFSTIVQVIVLIAASLGTFLFTVWMQRRESTGYFTKLAAMVAFACFAINIAMLGQIFNITPSDKALVPWAALALLLAYTCDLRLLLAAGILCIIAFIAARTGTWSGMYWLDFGERPENFFPAAVILFMVPQLVPHGRYGGFGPVYRVFAQLTLYLPMLVLGNWGRLSYFDLEPAVIEGAYQVLGFVLSAGAIWLGARRQWGEVVNTGSVFFVIFLYTKFYDWWWVIMPKYLFFLVLGLTAVLLIFVMRRLRARVYAHFGGKTS
jgi:uncharacterized membrane protein